MMPEFADAENGSGELGDSLRPPSRSLLNNMWVDTHNSDRSGLTGASLSRIVESAPTHHTRQESCGRSGVPS
jgi:hypothetical protein